MSDATDPKLLNQYLDRLRGALAVNLDWDTALVALNVPIKMITPLEQHPEIISMRKQMKAVLELELLELHRTARKIAASKGQGRPIEWMLEQINPATYGRGSNNTPQNPAMVHDDL